MSNSSALLGVQRYEIPSIIDYSARALCLMVHMAYFILVITFKDLQKIPLINMHHTNFIGLLTSIHYCIWIVWQEPNPENEYIYRKFCSVSESVWALTRFSRNFSILVLAMYRLLAVFHVTTFKKIIKMTKLHILAALTVWSLSAIVFMIGKFYSHTSPGLLLCFDGYSPSIQNSVTYYVITSVLGYLVPACLVIIAYVSIRVKLNAIDSRLSGNFCRHGNRHNVESSYDYSKNCPHMISTKSKTKEHGLAKQLIVINFLEVSSCVFFTLVSSSNVITEFSNRYYYARQLFRIGNLICQTLIPIASLVYSPAFKKTILILKFRL